MFILTFIYCLKEEQKLLRNQLNCTITQISIYMWYMSIELNLMIRANQLEVIWLFGSSLYSNDLWHSRSFYTKKQAVMYCDVIMIWIQITSVVTRRVGSHSDYQCNSIKTWIIEENKIKPGIKCRRLATKMQEIGDLLWGNSYWIYHNILNILNPSFNH